MRGSGRRPTARTTLESIELGHLEIQERQIRRFPLNDRDGLPAGTRFAHDGHVID